MGGIEALQASIDGFERLRSSIAVVARRTDDARRHDLIGLRRQLSAQIAEMARLADAELKRLPGGDELVRAFRSEFSQFRTIMAMHQANWPAIRIGEQPGGYEASAATVDRATRELIAWMSSALAERPQLALAG